MGKSPLDTWCHNKYLSTDQRRTRSTRKGEFTSRYESVHLGSGSSGVLRGLEGTILSKCDRFWLWHSSILKEGGQCIAWSCSILGWKSGLIADGFLGSYRIHLRIPLSCSLNKKTGICKMLAIATSSTCDPHWPSCRIRLQYAVVVSLTIWFLNRDAFHWTKSARRVRTCG